SITVPIPSVAGDVTTTFEVTREGERIVVTGWGNIKRWQIHLVGIDAVEPVAEAEVTLSPQGVIVTPPPETDRLEIVLA
ncbi:MAG: hypothetical protein KDI62_30510, partial [Anaerolineae bacterium]|nr:hypothetical protein [Anaerolineae bacterium]